MPSIKTFLFYISIVTILAGKVSANDLKINTLQCEYLTNPLGIDSPEPRFTWQISSTTIGAKQTAFEIIVGTDSAQVLSDRDEMWKSGKIETGSSLAVYAGKLLQPFTKYYWKVKVWDGNNESNSSAVASFETGMMQVKNWQGDWISDTRDIHLKPAPWFRKEFETAKKIKSARAYIAVGGLFELSINGEKAGNHRLDPTYTRFDRRLLYVTHDVTHLVKEGKNAIGVLLGNGWYNHQSTAVWYFDEAPWRARPKFCMDLHLTYDDGSKEIISTGIDWKTALSPVIFNSIYTAEHQDARLKQTGWDSPGFDEKNWKNAIPVNAPSNNIVAQVLHPIRNVEDVPAKEMVKFSDTNYLFDLGRNISGVSQLKIKGEAGTDRSAPDSCRTPWQKRES